MSCPTCHGETDPKYRPFCSKRCADIDLGRWINGSYRVQTEEPPEEFAPDPSNAPVQH